MPMTYPAGSFCSAVNNDPYFGPDVVNFSNMTFPVPCPLSNVRRMFKNFIFTTLFFFQITYMLNDYKPKIPEGLISMTQNGEYAGKFEMTLEQEILFECWTYIGVISA
jgi:hypothetical protein